MPTLQQIEGIIYCILTLAVDTPRYIYIYTFSPSSSTLFPFDRAMSNITHNTTIYNVAY